MKLSGFGNRVRDLAYSLMRPETELRREIEAYLGLLSFMRYVQNLGQNPKPP